MYFFKLEDKQLQALIEQEGFVHHPSLPFSTLNGDERTIILDVGLTTIYRNACWQNFLNMPVNQETVNAMKKAQTLIIPLGFKYYNKPFSRRLFTKYITLYPNGFLQEWKKTFGLMIIRNAQAYYYDSEFYQETEEELRKKRRRKRRRYDHRQRQAANTLLRRLNTKYFQTRPITYQGLKMDIPCPIKNGSQPLALFNLHRFVSGTEPADLTTYSGFSEQVTAIARKAFIYKWRGVYTTELMTLTKYREFLRSNGMVQPDLPELPLYPNWY